MTPRSQTASLLMLGVTACAHPAAHPGVGAGAATARREIEARYAQIGDATVRKDAAALLDLYDPAYLAVNPAINQRFDYAAVAAYTRRQLAAVDTTLRLRNTIRAFTAGGPGGGAAVGDTAVADVCQEFARVQRSGDGVPRRVETSALQREVWVRRTDAWRRLRVEGVHGARWFVDAVRVDPGRPYTPGMPAHAPSPDPPTGCGAR